MVNICPGYITIINIIHLNAVLWHWPNVSVSSNEHTMLTYRLNRGHNKMKPVEQSPPTAAEPRTDAAFQPPLHTLTWDLLLRAAITALQHFKQPKTHLPVSHYLTRTRDDSGHTRSACQHLHSHSRQSSACCFPPVSYVISGASCPTTPQWDSIKTSKNALKGVNGMPMLHNG